MSAALLATLAGAALAGAVADAAVRERRRRVASASALAVLLRVGRRLGAPPAPGDLDARLVAAGRPLGLRAADVMALKAAGAVATLLLGLPLAAPLPGRLPLILPVVLPLAGFLAPDWWLRRRARVRGRTMEAELPDLLDLLRVALGAGLALDRALAEVARHDEGLIARECRLASAQVELGVARGEALEALAARCPTAGVARLVRTLERAARHGVPLGDALAAQAREARAARARRIAEQAARAAPQIQLVVALVLVPSVLLLVAAALLASFLA